MRHRPNSVRTVISHLWMLGNCAEDVQRRNLKKKNFGNLSETGWMIFRLSHRQKRTRPRSLLSIAGFQSLPTIFCCTSKCSTDKTDSAEWYKRWTTGKWFHPRIACKTGRMAYEFTRISLARPSSSRSYAASIPCHQSQVRSWIDPSSEQPD